MPAGAVYVGRPGRWGNNFIVDDDLTLDESLYLYRQTLAMSYAPDPTELAGLDLACWCPLDQPCHADILLELANRPAGTLTATDQP